MCAVSVLFTNQKLTHFQNNSATTNMSNSNKSTKRSRIEEKWTENVRKKLRNTGQEYMAGKTGKLKSARKMGEPCTTNCRLKCSENITHDQRVSIFDDFWKIGSYQRQRDYLAGLVHKGENNKNLYHLGAAKKRVEVCRTFFINTLGISINTITWLLKKVNDSGGVLPPPDQRGKVNHFRISDDKKDIVRNFITSLPKIGKDLKTSHEFIDAKIYKSVTELYKHYSAVVIKDRRVTESMFRNLFKTEFSIRFK